MRSIIVVVVLASFAGCVDDADGPDGGNHVVIETDKGDIVLELAVDDAPTTVENFLKYVDDGFYDGTLFHRIIEGFMIQGGGMDTEGDFKDPTYAPIENEAASSGLKNIQYSISMARGSAADSATNQFFINHGENAFLDPAGSGAGYAVFGHVVDGQDVVDAIAAVPVEMYEGRPDQHCQGDQQPSCPIDDVVIQTIRRGSGDASDGQAATTPAGVSETPPAAFACITGSDPASSGVVADTIAPGILCITHPSEEVLVWARNFGDTDAILEWELTGPEGDSLPEGWTAQFDQSQATLGPARSSTESTHTMLRLTVPEGTDGEFDVELRTGHSVTSLQAHVDLRHDELAQNGDEVTISYAGRCASDDRAFDDGQFSFTLGGGRTVTGFDLGFIGMGHREAATLYIPAPLAYGYEGGPCAGEQADLIFDVELLSL